MTLPLALRGKPETKTNLRGRLSLGTGNAPYEISKFALRGGFFQWREIIKGAIFLTTDNAQAQVTLLIGPEKIRRCGNYRA
jgi:hypothetical protein